MCMSVCPVYKILGDERSSPRAKVHLIRSHDAKKIESSPLLQELISTCLMCGSCKTICPLGIDHYAEFMEMRKQMVLDHGEKISMKGLVYLLSKKQRLKVAASFARLGQSIAPSILKEKIKIADIPVSKFPELNKKPLRSALPSTIPAEGKEIGTVIYFTGCASNYIFDATGFATVRVLTRLGYRVLIPQSQTCCALPPMFHGFVKEAEESIKTNLKALMVEDGQDIDAIIVDCATCGTALKSEYRLLVDELRLDASAVEYISSKVVNIIPFLMRSGALAKRGLRVAQPIKITYHLPCHLKNSPDKGTMIGDLASLSPKIEYVKAVDFDNCCGGGGTFFYEHPEIAKKLIGEKVANATKTGAQILLTDCPVCKINFDGNLNADDNLEVMHPICFIDELTKD